mgnify:CR=1 FL=1
MTSLMTLLLVGCGDEAQTNTDKTETPTQVEEVVEKKAKVDPPKPAQEPLMGEPVPSLLVTQAWFWKDENGDSQPGPARLEIWRSKADGWDRVRLEDSDSNVFHKAIPFQGGILTIGAERALLKHWTMKDGRWNSETLWERDWKGKFNRLRDIEVGDVNHDGKEDLVIATHDAGVVAVIEPKTADSKQTLIELDEVKDTFVHEIEIGDIDGDGKLEFFATPSDRNQSKKSQAGKVVMYRWDGTEYKRTIVEEYKKTHAKEILVADVTGDNRSELFSVLEAERVGKAIIKPVEIRQYTEQADGSFKGEAAFTLKDEQCRFLVPGDFDHDGKIDLVAAGYHSGLWIARQTDDGQWETTLIDKDSSGFEHTSYATDIDGDGKAELVVAADNQASLNIYRWNGTAFDKEKIGDIAPNTFTWNIVQGNF